MSDDYPEGFDTDPTSPGFVPGEEFEVVPLDEPSMEDYRDGYIEPDEFGAPPIRVVKVREGVKDTKS